jgi:hypothetical protein
MFAAKQTQANIFHHAAWSELMQACYGYRPFVAILRDPNGQITVGIPMMEVNGLFGRRRWVSIPFSDHCSPLSQEAIASDELIQAVTCEAQKDEKRKVEIRWDLFHRSTAPDFVLHTLRLESDFDKVSRGIHHSHLRNVRLGQGHGIQIVHGVGEQELSAFYDLHLQTRHRQGVPIQPWKYFKLLGDLILQQGLGFISLAWHDTTCLAGAIFLYWGSTLTYKYGASTDQGMSMRANHLLFWDAIRWGCQNGYSVLDFGRTDYKNEGLRLFKGRWGAVESPLYYSTIPSGSQQRGSIEGPKSLMEAFIKRSPLWVCRLSGELLYRYFA